MKYTLNKFKDKTIDLVSSRSTINLGFVAFIMAITGITKDIVLFCFLMFILIIWNIVEDQYEVFEDADSKGDK
jgi:hypothetical protein